MNTGREILFAGPTIGERGITLKSPREIESMRQAGWVVAKALDSMMKAIASRA